MTLLKGLEFKLGFVPLFYLPVPLFLSSRFSYIDLAFVRSNNSWETNKTQGILNGMPLPSWIRKLKRASSFVTYWRHLNNLLPFFHLKQ